MISDASFWPGVDREVTTNSNVSRFKELSRPACTCGFRFSPNFARTLRKCLKRLNTRKICSHNGRNKSLDVASSEDSNRSTWALGRFFSCAITSRTSPKAQCSHCSLAKASNSKHLCSAKAKFGLVRVCLRRSNTLNHLDHLVGTG
jgi:hypothetical protein